MRRYDCSIRMKEKRYFQLLLLLYQNLARNQREFATPFTKFLRCFYSQKINLISIFTFLNFSK